MQHGEMCRYCRVLYFADFCELSPQTWARSDLCEKTDSTSSSLSDDDQASVASSSGCSSAGSTSDYYHQHAPAPAPAKRQTPYPLARGNSAAPSAAASLAAARHGTALASARLPPPPLVQVFALPGQPLGATALGMGALHHMPGVPQMPALFDPLACSGSLLAPSPMVMLPAATLASFQAMLLAQQQQQFGLRMPLLAPVSAAVM